MVLAEGAAMTDIDDAELLRTIHVEAKDFAVRRLVEVVQRLQNRVSALEAREKFLAQAAKVGPLPTGALVTSAAPDAAPSLRQELKQAAALADLQRHLSQDDTSAPRGFGVCDGSMECECGGCRSVATAPDAAPAVRPTCETCGDEVEVTMDGVRVDGAHYQYKVTCPRCVPACTCGMPDATTDPVYLHANWCATRTAKTSDAAPAVRPEQFPFYINHLACVGEQRVVCGAYVRSLAPAEFLDRAIYLERPGEPDRLIRDSEDVDLLQDYGPARFHMVPNGAMGG